MSRRRETIDQPGNSDGAKYRVRWGTSTRYVKREIIQSGPTTLDHDQPVNIEALKTQLQDQFTSSDHSRKTRKRN